jgi:hypothetical protein
MSQGRIVNNRSGEHLNLLKSFTRWKLLKSLSIYLRLEQFWTSGVFVRRNLCVRQKGIDDKVLKKQFLSELTGSAIGAFSLKCGVQKSEWPLPVGLLTFSPALCNLMHLQCQTRPMPVNYWTAVNTKPVACRVDRCMSVFSNPSSQSMRFSD